MSLESGNLDPKRLESLKARQLEDAYVNHSANIFKENLDKFLANKTDRIKLFKGDYSDMQSGVTVFKIPDSENFAKETKLLRKFMILIEDYLIDEPPAIGVFKMLPRPDTNALREYIKKDPLKQVEVFNVEYKLSDPEMGKEIIIQRKYKDIENGKLISSVWSAFRYLPDSVEDVLKQNKKKPISSMLLKPAVSISRR